MEWEQLWVLSLFRDDDRVVELEGGSGCITSWIH